MPSDLRNVSKRSPSTACGRASGCRRGDDDRVLCRRGDAAGVPDGIKELRAKGGEFRLFVPARVTPRPAAKRVRKASPPAMGDAAALAGNSPRR